MLFHFGEVDQNPSQEDMKKLDAELTRLGKPHQFYTYPGADHAFMDFAQPKFMPTSAEVNRQTIGPDNLLRLSRDWRLAVSPGTRTSMGIAIRVVQNPIIRVK